MEALVAHEYVKEALTCRVYLTIPLQILRKPSDLLRVSLKCLDYHAIVVDEVVPFILSELVPKDARYSLC